MLTKLFVGMLADFFASSSGNLLLTTEQRNWQFLHLFILHVIKIRKVPTGQLRLLCFRIAGHRFTRRTVHTVCVLNVIQLIGVASVTTMDVSIIRPLLAGQWLAIIVYTLEAIVKCVAYSPAVYLQESKLEIFILAGMYTATLEWQLRALVPGFSSATWVVQALQSCRVLRLATVLGSHSAQMRKVYYTVAVTLPQCLNLVICMVVVFHCFAVFGRKLCGGIVHSQAGMINALDNFDTSVSTMRVLFQIATGQSFSGYITECRAASAHPEFVTPFFFSFFVVGK